MIKGYKELSADEITMVNKIKDLADIVGQTLMVFEGDETVDQRWLAIAKTDLQKGFMAFTRSLTKPTTF